MANGIAGAWVALALGAASVSCGPSPGTPSAPLSFGVSMPAPVAPVGGALVLNSADSGIILTVRNAVSAQSQPTLLVVEVSPETTFTSPAGWTVTVPQVDGATTPVRIALATQAPDARTTYYWRVHATTGEISSLRSPVASFTFGGDPGSRLTVPDPPTLVSPAAGSNVGRGFNRYWISAATTTPNVIGFHIQFSTNSTFTQNVQTCVGSSLGGTNLSYCDITLSPGNYFWRAQAIAEGNGSSIATGLPGAFSPALPFKVIDETLGTPLIVSQALGAPSTNPVSITVQNAARTGLVGRVAYAFTVIAGDGGLPFPAVATATVAEDASGTTTWMLPFDLPVYQLYSVLVHAVDTTSGAFGEDSIGRVTVIPASSVALTMEIDLPGALGNPCHAKTQFPVTASHGLGGSVTITSGFGLTMALREIVPKKLAGMVEGRFDAAEGEYYIDGNTKPQATISGTIADSAHASGALTGRVTLETNLLENVTCSMTGANWSLVPR